MRLSWHLDEVKSSMESEEVEEKGKEINRPVSDNIQRLVRQIEA